MTAPQPSHTVLKWRPLSYLSRKHKWNMPAGPNWTPREPVEVELWNHQRVVVRPWSPGDVRRSDGAIRVQGAFGDGWELFRMTWVRRGPRFERALDYGWVEADGYAHIKGLVCVERRRGWGMARKPGAPQDPRYLK